MSSVKSIQSISEFPPTSWTLIRNAPHDRAALARLCELYRGPVVLFFCQMVRHADRAEDLTQDFFTEKIIGDGRVLSRADRSRGKRFRSYLRTIMRRFFIDWVRESRDEAKSGTGMEFDALPSKIRGAIREFEREWAITIITNAQERVKASCIKRGMERNWTVFEARKLRPMLLGVDAMPFEEVAKMIDARDRIEVDAILQNMNQKFLKTFRQVVAETIDSDDPADIDREIEQIKAALAP